MSDKARLAFEQWWTSGAPDSPTRQMALASPAAETAWNTFLVGWHAHRNRKRADNEYSVKLESDSE